MNEKLAKAVAVEAVINCGILTFGPSETEGSQSVLEAIAEDRLRVLDPDVEGAEEAAKLIAEWQKRMDAGESIVDFIWSQDNEQEA